MSEQTKPVIAARRGDAQRLTYRITPQPGSLMSAKGIGGQLTAIADLIEALAKDQGGPRVHVMIANMHTDAEGTISFDLVCLPDAEDVETACQEPNR